MFGQFEVEVARLINTVMESDFGMRQTDDLNSYICDQLLALGSHLEKDVFIRVLNIIYHHILQSFLNVVEGEVQLSYSSQNFVPFSFNYNDFIFKNRKSANLPASANGKNC